MKSIHLITSQVLTANRHTQTNQIGRGCKKTAFAKNEKWSIISITSRLGPLSAVSRRESQSVTTFQPYQKCILTYFSGVLSTGCFFVPVPDAVNLRIWGRNVGHTNCSIKRAALWSNWQYRKMFRGNLQRLSWKSDVCYILLRWDFARTECNERFMCVSRRLEKPWKGIEESDRKKVSNVSCWNLFASWYLFGEASYAPAEHHNRK